jgi:hypothetical protein
MKTKIFIKVKYLGSFILLGIILFPNLAHAQKGIIKDIKSIVGSKSYIRWAGESSVAGWRGSNALHAPDLSFTTFDPSMTLGNFGNSMRYSNLEKLLGVSKEVLAKADVIAFEGNGCGGAGKFNGWESTTFNFMDGSNSRTVSYNENQGMASDSSILATGSIETEKYGDFFGMCNLKDTKCTAKGFEGRPTYVSYILIDLDVGTPLIRKDSPTFSIQATNGYRTDGSFGEGTPDPDAIGIFSSCSF